MSMFDVFQVDVDYDIPAHASSGHRPHPGRKASKTDNARAMTAAAGGLGALAAANKDFFKETCKNLKERTGGRFDITSVPA
jgi:hypothetical protein